MSFSYDVCVMILVRKSSHKQFVYFSYNTYYIISKKSQARRKQNEIDQALIAVQNIYFIIIS